MHPAEQKSYRLEMGFDFPVTVAANLLKVEVGNSSFISGWGAVSKPDLRLEGRGKKSDGFRTRDIGHHQSFRLHQRPQKNDHVYVILDGKSLS